MTLEELPGLTGRSRKLKVVMAGGHPDDPETCAGGTAARYADRGHEVVMLYLTKGEAGIKGKTPEETAAQRTGEVEKACAILKCRSRFAGQIDGKTELSPARYREFRAILEDEQPDVVFTHWPLDRHRDHGTVSLLVRDALAYGRKKFVLYYFAGYKTEQFPPSHYVNIAPAEARKREACFCHHWYRERVDLNLWEKMEMLHRYRGFESGYPAAEAFIRHAMSRGDDGDLALHG